MNHILRGMDRGQNFRFFLANTTELTKEMKEIHKLSETATAALGRTAAVSAIIASMMKNLKDKITVQIQGNGPGGKLILVASSTGGIKATVDHPEIELPLKSNGKLDVGGYVGKDGQMIIIRDLGLKEPYVGRSPLVSGEIAEDFAYYFAMSEQQPSVVNLGVLFNKEGEVETAGGILIQTMPDISEEVLIQLEKDVASMPSFTKAAQISTDPKERLHSLLPSFELDFMDEMPVFWECDCSRERMEQALLALGKDELKSLMDEDDSTEMHCHFCNTNYRFNKEDLLQLIQESNG
ncbi:Hsp33 family molecular chaperone HslO [Gottschalkiaceae bacterium SANA]|nr:Hsp33 family molecular chaperone HslO [Gottschalkiaceae bacterium SANA]